MHFFPIRILILFIAVFAVVTHSTTAKAAFNSCAEVFSPALPWAEDPHLALMRILQVDHSTSTRSASKPESRAERRTHRQIHRIDLRRPLSTDDVNVIVNRLFRMRYGSHVGYRTILRDSQKTFEARMLRLIEEESAKSGIKRFMLDRNLLIDESRLSTQWARMYGSNIFQTLFAATSLASLGGPFPVLYLPEVTLFKVEPNQLQTLMIEGRDSEAGRQVMQQLFPSSRNDVRYFVVSRAINRAIMLATVIFYVWSSIEEQERQAVANGDLLIESLMNRMSEISAQASGQADTREDLLFDVVTRKASENKGSALSADELRMVCSRIPAPNRCRTLIER